MTNDETNPKSEIRNPKEIRMPKPEIRKRQRKRAQLRALSQGSARSASDFVIRISFGFRHSSFVIRVLRQLLP
jgi:hypothetical protein